MPRTSTLLQRNVDMRGQGRVYQRGKIWWVEWWHNNSPYRESSRSVERKDAQVLLNKRLADRDQGILPQSRGQQLRVEHILQQYLTDLELRNVDSLETSLRSHHKPIQHFFNNYRPEQLTPALIDRYKQQRLQAGRAISTVNSELRILRAAMRFAVGRNLMLRVPRITLLPGEHIREGFIEWDELQQVLPCLPLYLQPFIQFAYWTGWRRKELTTLEWRDIDWQHGVIRLRPANSKTRVGRVVGISKPLRAILEGQWAHRIVKDHFVAYVFHRNGRQIGNYYKAWRKAWDTAGLPRRLLHDCRRTAARNMVYAGNPERVAMQVTGHKSRTVFDRYTIVAPEQTETAIDRTADYIANQPKKVVGLRGKD